MGDPTRNASYFVIFFLFGMWLLMSAITPLITTLGIVSSLAAAMAHLMGVLTKTGCQHMFAPAQLSCRLCREIITANIDTGRIILTQDVKEEWFSVPTSQTSDAGLVTYANSITLTPGTVTVDIITTKMKEHALVHGCIPISEMMCAVARWTQVSIVEGGSR